MAKSPAKHTMAKRTGSKESGASMMVTGPGMREPSANPDSVSHVPAAHAHVPATAPVQHVAPQKDTKTEILRYQSNVSQKNVREKDKDKAGKFAFAAHPLQIDVDGSFFVDQGAVIVYNTTFRSHVMRASKSVRKGSQAAFAHHYVANQMINWIQDRAVFEKQRRPDSRAEGRRNLLDPDRGGPKRSQLIEMINGIVDSAIEIFRSEPRVLKINQPVIVFGDVHGNLADLMVYERLFWKTFPSVLPWNYLFLGDYVDRSKYSLETILYLLSQKIVCKDKFSLLRGNHEFSNVNREFSFRKEMITTFGEREGDIIWRKINTAFDYMPMCAVINSRVFCCHGGVPSSSRPGEVCTIKELEAISCPYFGLDPAKPESGGPAWELVWNDPMDKDEFGAVVEETRSEITDKAAMLKTGFATNTKRQTGKFFSEIATRNFLSTNNLDYVLRAHECVRPGYETKHSGLTTTVFSSSGYSGNNNAAIIMVNEGRIRPVRVKTKNDTHSRNH